jgi:gluconate 5-dehydrogenase
MGELDGKIAIITGGSRGIGRQIAMKYAKAGANIVVASREKKYLDRVVDKIQALGRESLAIATDVSIPEQVDNLIKRALDKFGRIDIMVNNAGRGISTPPEEISTKEWDEIIGLNLTGVFLGCKAAGKVMIKQKSGNIINISSVAGVKGSPDMLHYSVAKAGVIILSQNLAASWAEHNIKVNCIAPGLTATKGVMNWKPELLNPENEDGTLKPELLRPPGPENIADLALFLVSSASDKITGELFIIRSHFAWDR